MIAAQNGHIEIVRLLIAAHADIHKETCIDRLTVTPLIIAAQNGHTEVVRLLLAEGAEIDKPRNDGARPYLWPQKITILKQCELLISSGAKKR